MAFLQELVGILCNSGSELIFLSSSKILYDRAYPFVLRAIIKGAIQKLGMGDSMKLPNIFLIIKSFINSKGYSQVHGCVLNGKKSSKKETI